MTEAASLKQAEGPQASIGISGAEAERRLREFGPNAVAEETPARWRLLLAKFWAPVPWMLEATIALQLALGEVLEAAVAAFLLVFNMLLGFFQESRTNAALAAALALSGTLIAPLPGRLLLAVFLAAAAFALILDRIKTPVMAAFRVGRRDDRLPTGEA